MKSKAKKTGIIVFILILGTSFIPVDRSNPDTQFDSSIPDTVKSIFKESCYDCHSNQTDWPFYAYISPISFWIADHVKDARSHLNFSLWGIYDKKSRATKAKEIIEEIEKGEMPLKSYLWIHRSAKLTERKKQIMKNYLNQFASEYPSDDEPDDD
jgi:hypothetical protein